MRAPEAPRENSSCTGIVFKLEFQPNTAGGKRLDVAQNAVRASSSCCDGDSTITVAEYGNGESETDIAANKKRCKKQLNQGYTPIGIGMKCWQEGPHLTCPINFVVLVPIFPWHVAQAQASLESLICMFA